jgi:hypothetical protein
MNLAGRFADRQVGQLGQGGADASHVEVNVGESSDNADDLEISASVKPCRLPQFHVVLGEPARINRDPMGNVLLQRILGTRSTRPRSPGSANDSATL